MTQTSPQGFVVALDSQLTKFFTARSSYDKPQYTTLSEATVYFSAERADAALKNLFKNGSYSARVVPLDSLNESAEAAVPPKFSAGEKVKKVTPSPEDSNEGEAVVASEDAEHSITVVKKDGKQLASNSADYEKVKESEQDGCDDCDDCDAEDEESAGRQHHGERVWRGDTDGQSWIEIANGKRYGPYPSKSAAAAELLNRADLRKFKGKVVTESTSAPTEIDQYQYNDQAADSDVASATGTYPDSSNAVPASVKNSLKTAIKNMKDEAAKQQDVDNTQASFALTAEEALTQILNHLNDGTPDGIKQAQIKFSSLMSPIAFHVPSDVVLFLGRGGNKSSVKDLFMKKLTTKKGWDDQE